MSKTQAKINMTREQNEARVKNKLQPIISKKRRCLRCDKTFLSLHEERTCSGCREVNQRCYYR